MRLPDWEERLHDYLVGVGEPVFGYDHCREPAHIDCCVFAAGAVEAIVGDDPMIEFRGAYASRASARTALKTIGKVSLAHTLDAKFESVPPAFAQRGDLAMHAGSVGVVIGSDALFVGDGMSRVPRARWRRAWRVG